jgi:hypothetical protein
MFVPVESKSYDGCQKVVACGRHLISKREHSELESAD